MANETPSKLSWNRRRQRKADRLVAASPFADGRILAPETIVQALEILIRPGDDVTHVVTEEGVAYLYKARDLGERRSALAAIAGVTPVGLHHDARQTGKLRREGLVAFPEDLGIHPLDAKRSLLAAKSIEDLVAWVWNGGDRGTR
jgi:Malonate decarboxylase, alpha subunit, transporter